jgi:hypothetical protein
MQPITGRQTVECRGSQSPEVPGLDLGKVLASEGTGLVHLTRNELG